MSESAGKTKVPVAANTIPNRGVSTGFKRLGQFCSPAEHLKTRIRQPYLAGKQAVRSPDAIF